MTSTVCVGSPVTHVFLVRCGLAGDTRVPCAVSATCGALLLRKTSFFVCALAVPGRELRLRALLQRTAPCPGPA
eukprot:364905-Chlamydomonas_euryale.AAC.12